MPQCGRLPQPVDGLARSKRLLSAHCPGVGFFTPAGQPPLMALGSPGWFQENTLMLDVPPPPVKAEMTKTSPFAWDPLNPPAPLVEMTFWKNQMPILASPLGERRSAPNTTSKSVIL